jgi:multidrug efflux pump subunit AcrA (membrane-fusion protein)
LPEIINIEEHSAEVQEIMGHIPGSVIRWGLTVIFFIMAGILTGSFVFKSPEIIIAPMVMTTANPPVTLVARVSGKIERIFVKEGEYVGQATVVALINSPTDYQHYLILKDIITGYIQNGNSWYFAGDKPLPGDLILGDLQPTWTTFIKHVNNYKQYLNQGLIPKKVALIGGQVIKQEEYLSVQVRQKELYEQEFILASKSFARDSTLFGKEAISESEYEASRQQLLLKQAGLTGLEATLKSTETNILRMKENIIELQMQYEKELAQYHISLDEARQTLENSIKQWEEKYLAVSPVTGSVTFTRTWGENQEVLASNLIATVVPGNEMEVLAKAVIPNSGIGKVENGQLVNIKLNGYPYMEFGMVRGRIRSISLVPEENGYMADIELIAGLTTTYKEQLRFIQQMEGTAEIVTKDLRLIYRFINPLRALLDKSI